MLISTFRFFSTTAMVQIIFIGYLVNHSGCSHDKLQQFRPPIFKYKSRDARISDAYCVLGTGTSTAFLLVSIHEYDFCIYFEGLISVIVACSYIVRMVSAS